MRARALESRQPVSNESTSRAAVVCDSINKHSHNDLTDKAISLPSRRVERSYMVSLVRLYLSEGRLSISDTCKTRSTSTASHE